MLIPSALVVALLSWVAAGPAAAEPPSPPPYYAIENVRVVTGTGTTLESATVVIADGLIEAVGSGIEVPGDAWTIDGTDLTLYPALIDALTDLGQKKEAEGSEGGAGGGGGFPGPGSGPEIRSPLDRPKTTPWVSAADMMGDDGRVEKWREAGFGATVSAPTKGIFAGQAALIHLGDSEGKQRVLAPSVAHRVNFEQGRFGQFPSSLMGVFSYLRQTFSDTRHYAEVQALYAGSPQGRERPAYDRALAPIQTAMERGTPFLFPAHLAREIDRMLVLSESEEIETILYGGHAAYARVDELAAARMPVLVSLNWPEEGKDRDPEADTAFRTLYHRRMAPHTPHELAAAGVPFAFYSNGLATPGEIFEGVRAAIDSGLSEEDALRALTTGPAGIFGVADRIGTIEAGKIANLVLASAAPWAEDVEIAAVFVDGRRYQGRKSDEPTEPPAMDVSGTWAMTLNTPGGAREMTAEVDMAEDGKVTGEITGESGSTAMDDAKMSGDLLRFETTRSLGGRSMTASWSLTVEGESLSGAMSAGPMSMDVTGSRTATAAKEEGGESDDGEADDEISLAEMAEVMALVHGPVREVGSFAITNATIWTVSGETIEDGTVVVRDGRIAAVGADVELPAGVEVIDAAGGSVIPGIIDAHSHIAGEGGLNEGSFSVTSMVRVADVINPDDVAIYRALAGGVTAANILHGSSNPIGGQNQVIKLRWGASAEGLKFENAKPGIKFALGENPKRSNFRSFNFPQRYPQTRLGVMDVIRNAFSEATIYRDEWQAFEAAEAAGRSPNPPRRDLALEALVEILEGERLVHSHCYRADEILQLLRLAEDFGFTVGTLQHVLEGYKVADEIAAHGAGASTFSDWWGYKVEAYDAIPHAAALMAERGVLVSINSDSGEEMRHLNQEAAKAVRWGGMDEIEALKLVTLNPAIQFRVDDRVGSIEVGKDADLVIYDGHPLSMMSVVQKTFVDGDLYFDREADRERQQRIDDIKARISGDDEEGDESDGDSEEGGSEPPPEVRWHDDVYTCRENH
jgi:imidazolonepropionase-like amidohydrolase